MVNTFHGRLRSRIEAKLDRPIPEQVWSYLVDRGDVDAALEPRDGFLEDDVVVEVEKLEAMLLGRTAKPSLTVGLVPGPLVEAVVDQVSQREDVVAFRRDQMNGKLLPLGRVKAWVETRAKKESPPTLWRTVPDGQRGDIPGGRSIELLAYPHEGWVHRVPTRVDGTLERLRLIAESVARSTGWIEAEAVAFILTGVPARLPSVSGHPRRGPYVQLSVHPSTAPREVGRAYAELRREQLRWSTGRGLGPAGEDKRIRRMSEKHHRLALFIRRNPKTKDRTWRELMQLWNQADGIRKEWHYSRETNFADHAVRARRRWEERRYA